MASKIDVPRLSRRMALGVLVAGAIGAGASVMAQPHGDDRVRRAPPPPRRERIPRPPFRGAVWVPGHWSWKNRRYVWVGGRYLRPQPGKHWTAGRWHQNGGYWVYVPGRWDR